MPNIKQEFKKISKEMRSHFKKQRINSEDVSGAIKWVRKK